MTRIAIFQPFSGISGDMILGSLVQCGLDPQFIRDLPGELGIKDIGVQVGSVDRSGISCAKVDFEIPPQPHGRHLRHILAIIEGSRAPAEVKAVAGDAFTAITTVEAQMHGSTVEKVHLHEVGSVDAILDIVGSIWGLRILGVERCHTGAISLGDGEVSTSHGILPVPAPATAALLTGFLVRPGPPGSGELVTPTGAAILRALKASAEPAEYVPIVAGYGAGTREIAGRPNALRLVLAESSEGRASESLVLLATDIDDMTGEELGNAAERLREAGALDVFVTGTQMKKGRPGERLEVLCSPDQVQKLESGMFDLTSTIGVRRQLVERTSLFRRDVMVPLHGQVVTVKVAILPSGRLRTKGDFAEIEKVSVATGRSRRTLQAELERWVRENIDPAGEVITSD